MIHEYMASVGEPFTQSAKVDSTIIPR